MEMRITHEEARKLIQSDMDQALDFDHRATLAAHLKACSECNAFAEDIKEIERVLPPLMKRQWALKPLPLSISTVVRERNTKAAGDFLATRTALVVLMFLAFVFSAWQLMLSSTGSTRQTPVGAVPVSTPSLQLTSTKIRPEDCETILYTVQGNETLAGIARRFSISKEEIMTINEMKTETVNSAMQLVIPVCHFTPTGTVEGPTLFSTTFTPLLSPRTSTPGPGG